MSNKRETEEEKAKLLKQLKKQKQSKVSEQTTVNK
jgi:hypothetical protein